MKHQSKLIFILLFLSFVITTSAQSGDLNTADDEFNLFLLSLVAVFFCVMIAAAILGAIVTSLILFVLFALIALGVLSISAAIGLYKRSFAAGFKSFLMILFITGCAVIGGVGLVLADYFFNLPMSTGVNFTIGIISGGLGGLIMASATYHSFLWIIKIMTQRYRAT